MRAGTNGMFYYAGLAFDRGDNKPSAIFVARYMDLNNVEAGDPFGYVGHAFRRFGPRARGSSTSRRWRPTFRAAAATCTHRQHAVQRRTSGTIVQQTIPAGNVYVAYSAFTGQGADEQSVIMFSRSTDCGQTWSAPNALSTGSRLVQNAQIAVSPVDGAVYVSWRRFKYLDAGRRRHGREVDRRRRDVRQAAARLRRAPVRSGHDLDTSFRTNGFQTMAIDATGRVYLAWPDRGYAAARPAIR